MEWLAVRILDVLFEICLNKKNVKNVFSLRMFAPRALFVVMATSKKKTPVEPNSSFEFPDTYRLEFLQHFSFPISVFVIYYVHSQCAPTLIRMQPR